MSEVIEANAVARLEPGSNASLAREVPVFAAEPDFVRRAGGDCALAFLDALPNDWGSDSVIDSALVWLAQGSSPGPRFFHSEPFPGALSGPRADANAELDCETIACCFGVDVGEELAFGELGDLSPLNLEGQPNARQIAESLGSRHVEVERRVREGSVHVKRFEPATLYRYGPKAMRRFLSSPTSGFHFCIRATRGSARPVVSLLRTVTTVGF